jgi:hypothetical protein
MHRVGWEQMFSLAAENAALWSFVGELRERAEREILTWEPSPTALVRDISLWCARYGDAERLFQAIVGIGQVRNIPLHERGRQQGIAAYDAVLRALQSERAKKKPLKPDDQVSARQMRRRKKQQPRT